MAYYVGMRPHGLDTGGPVARNGSSKELHVQTSPAVAVVVLNWRTPDLAIRCVRSVLDSTFAGGGLATIVVDNASGDGSSETLRARFGDAVRVIENPVNNGYAGGMNAGLRKAREIGARYALLLNADIELGPDTIHRLFAAAESRPDGAFFGPRIHDIDMAGDRWFVGGRWDWGQGTIRVIHERASDGLPVEPRHLEFVNGAAMFVRLSALERTGEFDERFGLYFEESDLCSRAARTGCTLWHVPSATVSHVCGASTSKASECDRIDLGLYYRTRNRLLWGRGNLTGARALSFWFNVLLRFPIKLLILILQRRPTQSQAMLLGIRDFVTGRLGMWGRGTTDYGSDKTAQSRYPMV